MSCAAYESSAAHYWSDSRALRSVAWLAKNLDVALGVTATFDNGNFVIEFQAFIRATFYAFAVVTPPDKESDFFGNVTSYCWNPFEHFDLVLQSLFFLFVFEHAMLDHQHARFLAVMCALVFKSQNLFLIDP